MILRTTLISLAVLTTGVFAQKIDGAPPVIGGEHVITKPGKHVMLPANAPTIVPAADATRITNRANSIPWSWTPTHFQAPYLGTEMPASLLIRCIGFRHGGRTDTGARIDLEMWLGYTTYSNTNITNNYANNANQGALTKVFDRKMYNVVDMETRNTDPAFFKNQLPLDRPFVWQQQAGRNLLFECKVYGNSNTNRSFSYFTEQCSTGGTTARIYSNNNANATTGFVSRSLGPVLSFDTACKTTATFETYGAGCKGTGGFAGIVLPGGYDTKFGESNNSFPHSYGNMRYQQLHAGSDLGARPLTLNALSLRQDDRSTGRAGSMQNLKISVGQTDSNSGTLDANLDKHFDTNGPTVVFDGTVNLPTLTGLNTNPGQLFSVAAFTRNYVWVPRPGKNFLIEIVNSSTARNMTMFLDAASNVLAGIDCCRAYSTASPTATTATTITRNYGLVLGLGVAGGTGSAVPVLGNNGRPVAGNATFAVTLNQAKGSSAALLGFGFSDSMWGAINLPLDLTPFGAGGCNLLASLDLTFAATTSATGDASVTIPIPATLRPGRNFYVQWLVIDSGANSLGFAFTAGGKATTGEQ